MGVITFNEFKGPKNDTDSVSKPNEDKILENVTEEIKNEIKEVLSDNFPGYKLYRDKQENFCCEVCIEGAKLESSSVRLIIESSEWNLFFNGIIEKNGKCIIPIKKLPILSEGTTGKIKLEVTAEDTIFVPWEEDFIVKNNKKVTVKIVEQENFNKPRVKVNF